MRPVRCTQLRWMAEDGGKRKLSTSMPVPVAIVTHEPSELAKTKSVRPKTSLSPMRRGGFRECSKYVGART
jgi:hypothetical protein